MVIERRAVLLLKELQETLASAWRIFAVREAISALFVRCTPSPSTSFSSLTQLRHAEYAVAGKDRSVEMAGR